MAGTSNEIEGVGGRSPSEAGPCSPPAAGAWLGDVPILDIPTPDDGMSIRTNLSPRSRRLFSRAVLGTKLPGRYYFLTATSSPKEPLEPKKHWDMLRKYLKKHNPNTSHLHVTTNEGFGVIHIVLRLGNDEPRLEIVPFRDWWFQYHKATQCKIVQVRHEKMDLCRYISDQRHKKGLAGEMAWQDDIVSWGYSKGWLPKGFGKQFGRFWWKSRDASMGDREKMVYPWLLRCYLDEEEMKYPPVVRSGRGLQ
jgi:hypothetical protein